MAFLERWKSRLPKEKTEEELNEYYDRIEEMDVDRGEFFAMFVGAWMALWPILLMVAVIILVPMLFFRVF